MLPTPLEQYLSLYSLMMDAASLKDDNLYDAVTAVMDNIWGQLSDEEIAKLEKYY